MSKPKFPSSRSFHDHRPEEPVASNLSIKNFFQFNLTERPPRRSAR